MQTVIITWRMRMEITGITMHPVRWRPIERKESSVDIRQQTMEL